MIWKTLFLVSGIILMTIGAIQSNWVRAFLGLGLCFLSACIGGND